MVIGAVLLTLMGGLEAFMQDPENLSGMTGGMLGVLVLVSIPIIVISIIFLIKRLHDMDMSGWWSALFFILWMIPVVSLFAYLFIYFKPGSPGTNRFGPPGKPNSKAVRVTTILIGGLIGLLLVFALFGFVIATIGY